MQTTTRAGTGSSVATDETDRLIASNKVEGTAVYNRQGERLGEVYNFMVDKRSGQVAYAVLSFGGFLGMGQGVILLEMRGWDGLSERVMVASYSASSSFRTAASCRSSNSLKRKPRQRSAARISAANISFRADFAWIGSDDADGWLSG